MAINWIEKGPIPKATLEYSSDNGANWSMISNDIEVDMGEYLWEVPYDMSDNCIVRMTGLDYTQIDDVSDETFSIKQLDILSPTQGEQWQIGKPYTVSWESEFVDQVLVEYSEDAGNAWKTLATNVPASDGSVQIIAPDFESDNIIIRISESTHPDVFNQQTIQITNPLPQTRIELYENVSAHSLNPDNYIHPGRPLRLKIQLQNNYETNLLTLKGILRSKSPYVTVVDSIGTFNNILSTQKGWSVNEFEVILSPDIPYNTDAYFDFVVTDEIVSEGPWTSRGTIRIPLRPFEVPVVVIDDDNIPDSNGDNDDIAEPGETIEILPLLQNLNNSISAQRA